MVEFWKISHYVKHVVGLEFEVKDGNFKPYGMTSGNMMTFTFSLLLIEGREFLMLLPKDDLGLTGGVYAKKVTDIEKLTGKTVVLVLDSITSETRRALIAKRVNFIVPDKQLYLPSLMMCFTERGIDSKKRQKDQFAPATQVILFYHILRHSLDGMRLKDIADAVGYSPKAVGTAIAQIQNVGLCAVEQADGRTKVVHFSQNRLELWRLSQSYLISPISNVYYMDTPEIMGKTPRFFTYEWALSLCTKLASPTNESYAVDRNDMAIDELIKKGLLHKEEGLIRLEVWKYPPYVLSDNSNVDPLSLWMCLREEDDERVNGELERLIENKLTKLNGEYREDS
ncbi:MAG: hypothetical protein MJZ02_03745 [Paludibacteraceae bacterium]|nr:hypothetical protein [Paludibacteraceae bacterium]